MPDEVPRIAVLVTLDSKFDVTQFFCRTLKAAGADPWIMDLSLRAHSQDHSELVGRSPLDATCTTFTELQEKSRAEASQVMIDAGTTVLSDAFDSENLSGVIGIGGANGSTMACGIMRALAPLVPKVMVTPVAATAAVQWYVAQSNIAMFPTIGDISLNRITRAILEDAAHAITGMSRAQRMRMDREISSDPLIGVSTFGNLQVTVDRITSALEASGAEVIHFHASGPGGKALESLTRAGELQGLIDLTTSELTDFLAGGVYSAGAQRMTGAAQMGIPQIIVPGCIDFVNWWAGEVPEKFQAREFYQYNQEILLMRTNRDEFADLGRLFAERLCAPKGPLKILIPTRGFSQMTDFPTQDISGRRIGSWYQPDCDKVFSDTLKHNLTSKHIIELDMHINDPEFSEHTVIEFKKIMPTLN